MVGLVGLEGTGTWSSAAAEVVAALSVLTEAVDCRGDMATESVGREGSAALLRCQNRAGESGRAFRDIDADVSSCGREVILLNLDETWLEFLLELCFSALSSSRRPLGLAEVWYEVDIVIVASESWI